MTGMTNQPVKPKRGRKGEGLFARSPLRSEVKFTALGLLWRFAWAGGRDEDRGGLEEGGRAVTRSTRGKTGYVLRVWGGRD